MAASTPIVREVDTRRASAISERDADAFREAGVLVLRGLLGADELAALRVETQALVERAAASRVEDPDFQYRAHPDGGEVPFRVEYVVDKLPACRALLGHPFVLRSVERLQGRDFIPTWDSMVWKHPGAGAVVEWHRDCDRSQCDEARPIFNVDFYLDESDAENGLFALPGSQRWSDEEAARECAERNAAGAFRTDGACPLPLAPGDALLHDVLLVHGSPPARSTLRRVVYYEFRPADLELRLGPHTAAYVPAKQRVLLACLRARAAEPWAGAEAPYAYAPSEAFPAPTGDPPASHRVPHHEYWRWDLEQARQAARSRPEPA